MEAGLQLITHDLHHFFLLSIKTPQTLSLIQHGVPTMADGPP